MFGRVAGASNFLREIGHSSQLFWHNGGMASYSVTPRTATGLLRVHKRPTVRGGGDGAVFTPSSGKPSRPDLRCYPGSWGQGPEALITSSGLPDPDPGAEADAGATKRKTKSAG